MEYLEGTNSDTERTYKPHTEKSWSGPYFCEVTTETLCCPQTTVVLVYYMQIDTDENRQTKYGVDELMGVIFRLVHVPETMPMVMYISLMELLNAEVTVPRLMRMPPIITTGR